jgi:2-keto-4-pentenoate hydratase/2-oxohepta-3-ene-1,7-dioic acid hydratase in catechol pathway
MRLYNTDQGPAREDEPGVLTVVDLPDLGEMVRDGGLGRIESAPVVDKVPLADARLLAPVRRPGKVIIVGLNYGSHAQEALARFAAMGMPDMELPTVPNFFIVAASAVTGPGSAIRLPKAAPAQVDYEGEVAVVIGRDGADISTFDAWNHVAGLTVANDVSARDIQQRAMTGDPTATVATAKSFDTFKPLGPCLVTADEFGEPLDLRIRTRINNELRQDDRTSSFVHGIPDLIAYLSGYHVLQTGDVICTGTPAGAGLFSNRFLTPGDVVEVEVEGIGVLTNSVTTRRGPSHDDL